MSPRVQLKVLLLPACFPLPRGAHLIFLRVEVAGHHVPEALKALLTTDAAKLGASLLVPPQ